MAQADAPAEKKRFGSTLFWRLFAFINLITVCWVGWVIWQLTPHPVVNEFVLRLPVSQRSSSGAIPGRSPAAPDSAATVTPVAPAAPPAEIPLQSGTPMPPLRMETEIKPRPKPVK